MSSDKISHWSEDPSLVWQYAESLDRDHINRLAIDRLCIRLTYEKPQVGSSGYGWDRQSGDFHRNSGQQSFYEQGASLTREVIGAAAAQLSRSVQVKIIPSGADYDLSSKCEAATDAVNGILSEESFMTDTKHRVILDALHCSVGAARVGVKNKKIEIRRVSPLNLRWPMDQGSDICEIIEIHQVPRRKALAEWGVDDESRQKIKMAPIYRHPKIPGVDTYGSGHGRSDCIKVIEAWLVTIGDEIGRHVVAINDHVFVDDEYDHDCVPYVFMRYMPDFDSFAGLSLARIVAPQDIRIRRMDYMDDEALKGCVPVVWEHVNEIAFEGLESVAYQRAQYSGVEPPRITIPGRLSRDIDIRRNEIRQRAFAEAGVNYEMGRGAVPPGLKSAPAINSYSEVASLRLLQQQQRAEKFDIDIAKLICKFGPGTSAAIRSKDHDHLSEIQFPDLSKESYRATVVAGSGLPITLSGRISTIESIQGIKPDISPQLVGEMINIPDVQSANREMYAQRRLAEKICSEALKEGKWPELGLVQDIKFLQEIVPLSKSRLCEAQAKGTFPSKNLSVLHKISRVSSDMLEQLTRPPPPPPQNPGFQPPAGDGIPPGAPMPPPDGAVGPVPGGMPPGQPPIV